MPDPDARRSDPPTRLAPLAVASALLLGGGSALWLALASWRRAAVTGLLQWDRHELLAIALLGLLAAALGAELGRGQGRRLRIALVLVASCLVGFVADSCQPASWSSLPLGVALPVALPICAAALHAGALLAGVGALAPALLGWGAIGAALGLSVMHVGGLLDASRPALQAIAAICLFGAAGAAPRTGSGRRSPRQALAWPMAGLVGAVLTVVVACSWPTAAGPAARWIGQALAFGLGCWAAQRIGPGRRAGLAVLAAALVFLASDRQWDLGRDLALGCALGLSVRQGLSSRAVIAAIVAVALAALSLSLGASPGWVVASVVALLVAALGNRTWLATPIAAAVLVLAAVDTIWPAPARPAPFEQVVERRAGLTAVYQERRQELVLRLGALELDVAGPDRQHAALLAGLAATLLPRSARLLVLGGAGGTGTAAIQIGKCLGATVIATVAGEEKVEYCKQLGADHVIDRKEQDITEAVMELTGGQGANCVYDPVGGPAYTAASKCVAHEGRICLIGFASGQWGPVDPAHMVYQNYTVVGVIPSNYGRDYKEAVQKKLLGWWRDGKLSVRVEQLVPFEELPDALERLAASQVQGKLVLGVDANATAPGR